jgi:hypothetical protein
VTAYGAEIPACSESLLMANGDGTPRGVCKYLVLDGAELVRGRGVAEECAPCPHVGTWNLHGGPVISSVLGCGSEGVSLACVHSLEMQSDCGVVSKMESCRGGDGGGVDVRAEPCPDWVPFLRVDGARPWTLRDCDDACGLYWDFSRANALARAWSMGGRRCRWYDVWRNPSRRVALATMAWGRRCALGDAPLSSLYL